LLRFWWKSLPGSMGPGDCHDQCAHWSRNDRKLGAKRQTTICLPGLIGWNILLDLGLTGEV
ncbi:MAG: hypothetical protein SPE19_05295, partial [Candidatus Faecousia sp.]|nr:hypothetical protein [Candidatus Faecousia sp.]